MEMSHQREAEKPLLESIEIYKAVTPTGSLEMGTGQICCLNLKVYLKACSLALLL